MYRFSNRELILNLGVLEGMVDQIGARAALCEPIFLSDKSQISFSLGELMAAHAANNMDVIERLLQRFLADGVGINDRHVHINARHGTSISTLVFHAVDARNAEYTSLLMSMGADPTIPHEMIHTPDMAPKSGRHEIFGIDQQISALEKLGVVDIASMLRSFIARRAMDDLLEAQPTVPAPAARLMAM